MAINKNSVEYMKQYLKYAIEFEKYTYIWQNAMDEVNARMRQIYSQQKKLESVKTTVKSRLASLDDINERQLRLKKSEAVRYRKKAKNSLITAVIVLMLLFLAGCGFGYALSQSPDMTFIIP